MKITIVAGARPNFMKIAPIIKAINTEYSDKIQFRLVHTGQHYDRKMSGDFFEELGIPMPDSNLGAGGGTQAEQTASIMVGFEKELLANPTSVVLVVGDVTSTMACSITAKKLNIPVVHVEGGIRSGDMSMPEEINRIVTDSISDHFFTTSELANQNLQASGISADRIHFVGNTMIDTLLANLERLQDPNILHEGKELKPHKYIVLTLHRPANVDEEEKLKLMMDTIVNGCSPFPVVFPVHPRTAQILDQLGINYENLVTVEPLSYLKFNFLVKNALGVITDSGGITEETTILKVPCITLRDNTERPETVELGTNELVGTDPAKLPPFLEKMKSGNWKHGDTPPLWDGKAAQRIVKKLLEIYG
ncbi:UDP-N-acetylglucosamine 2-epimerase (non-hydrolyzing) [Litoribacter ruber]|uniref:UDP-N-acetylglucosamine 2-epimerase (Non-hydrolyzing) n=1 Tax=Litoribacter ruber TaxID=702568 RepID=A0AAP2CG27_9BACT|nr:MULTISPECIES: UDP-N-acetylglucosamine 2-epimerase (non-hydrolyzing) [Litoribacter]MBS9522521.1 UDP-N-acetylglucosamine 2-epimerase (non-hydrolyzing) [Litoribacter alkaliphilus]MBT0811041.1 UDP-N-acetylglucosamine 2-epimerase (non-hydrolyzing) [Litoribacter ruber]